MTDSLYGVFVVLVSSFTREAGIGLRSPAFVSLTEKAKICNFIPALCQSGLQISDADFICSTNLGLLGKKQRKDLYCCRLLRCDHLSWIPIQILRRRSLFIVLLPTIISRSPVPILLSPRSVQWVILLDSALTRLI